MGVDLLVVYYCLNCDKYLPKACNRAGHISKKLSNEEERLINEKPVTKWIEGYYTIIEPKYSAKNTFIAFFCETCLKTIGLESKCHEHHKTVPYFTEYYCTECGEFKEKPCTVVGHQSEILQDFGLEFFLRDSISYWLKKANKERFVVRYASSSS